MTKTVNGVRVDLVRRGHLTFVFRAGADAPTRALGGAAALGTVCHEGKRRFTARLRGGRGINGSAFGGEFGTFDGALAAVVG